MTGLVDVLNKYRRPLVVAIHLLIVILANYLAFWLRFEGAIPQEEWNLFVGMLPWLLAVRGVLFLPFRLYEGLWRYTSIWDLWHIIAGVGLSTVAFYGLVHWAFGHTAYPRSVFVMDSILLIGFLGGVRLTRRICREMGHPDREKRVLIYGAGDAGEMIVRDMLNNPFYEYEPIGFVDDDPAKVGQRIHGLKVLGTRESLSAIVREHKPDAILVAITRIEPAALRKLVEALERFALPIQIVPNFRDVLHGKVTVSQIRNLAFEDLLERAPVGLDPEPVRRLIRDKRVLVTGAGGSIGSELCRQILCCNPAGLVLLDRYENGLHAITCELESRAGCLSFSSLIGDVTDRARMQAVMHQYRPQVVFHAAAHKHVPLMEVSPCEAVKNNIIGTKVVAECAAEVGVERFILISTDKAVNPTSVMGATKRVAEMIVQHMAHANGGVYSAVRFGNVLGSNGSVVHRWLEQIKAGGPVTITHPEMRRFFMLIPEAVQLVLHAAALAEGGEVYVLEMGEQITMVEMARNLIQLAGFVPEEEIPIRYTGLRPGEKLYEELIGKDETVEPSGQDKILRVRSKWTAQRAGLREELASLEHHSYQSDSQAVMTLLKELVPAYQPNSSSGAMTVCAADGQVNGGG